MPKSLPIYIERHMSLPPSTSSSIFNSSYFQAGPLTLSVADKRYLLLSGGTIGGSLAATGTLSASSLSLSGTSPMLNLAAPTTVNNSLVITAGTQPSNTNGIGIRFVGMTSTSIIKSYNYVLNQANNISINDGAIYVKSDSKVGISNVAPAYALDITGFCNSSSGFKVSGTTIVDSSRNATFGTITATNYKTASYDLDDVDFGRLDGITAGTAAASKALVLSGNKDVGIIRRLSAQNMNLLGGGTTDDYSNAARLLCAIDSSMGNASSRYIALGRAFSNKNSGEISFRFESDGSDDNRMAFGGYSFSDTLNVFANSTVTIGTISRSNARLYVDSGVGSSTIAGSAQIEILSNTSLSQQIAPLTVSSPSIRTAGNVIVGQSLYVASDRRLKQDIDSISLDDATRFVQTCKPRHFVLKSRPDKQEFGYIAQDLLHARLGQLVDLQPDKKMRAEGDKFDIKGYRLHVSYDRVAPLLHTYMLDMDRRINYQPSDRRYLSSISNQDISDDHVLALRVRRWRRNTDGYSDMGLVAQECRAQFPELVRLDPDATMERTLPGDVHHQKLSVDYAKLGVVLLPVVQRLLRRVAALEQQFGVVHVEYVDDEL